MWMADIYTKTWVLLTEELVSINAGPGYVDSAPIEHCLAKNHAAASQLTPPFDPSRSIYVQTSDTGRIAPKIS